MYDLIESIISKMINKAMPLFGITFSLIYFAIGIYKTEYPNLEKMKICNNK